MIQDDIINELQYIPEFKLVEIYEFIHNIRLGFGNQLAQNEFKIDKTRCLNTLAKIKQGDFSDFSEIEDIDLHIQHLKNEIN
jgi:hypothetical protein